MEIIFCVEFHIWVLRLLSRYISFDSYSQKTATAEALLLSDPDRFGRWEPVHLLMAACLTKSVFSSSFNCFFSLVKSSNLPWEDRWLNLNVSLKVSDRWVCFSSCFQLIGQISVGEINNYWTIFILNLDLLGWTAGWNTGENALYAKTPYFSYFSQQCISSFLSPLSSFPFSFSFS